MTRLLSVLCLLSSVLCATVAHAAREIPNTTTAIVASVELEKLLVTEIITKEEYELLRPRLKAPLHYADLLAIVANAAPQGVSVEQMRQRIRILDACDRARDQPTIILEDADYTAALELVKAHRWGGVDRDLIAFTDAVENARQLPLSPSSP